jgi:hypothetical protein
VERAPQHFPAERQVVARHNPRDSNGNTHHLGQAQHPIAPRRRRQRGGHDGRIQAARDVVEERERHAAEEHGRDPFPELAVVLGLGHDFEIAPGRDEREEFREEPFPGARHRAIDRMVRRGTIDQVTNKRQESKSDGVGAARAIHKREIAE